jgi:hypothetical protein
MLGLEQEEWLFLSKAEICGYILSSQTWGWWFIDGSAFA